MLFRSLTYRDVKRTEPKGLPALPLPDADALLNARRTMDQLVAKRQYAKQVPWELVLPQLSAENLKFLEQSVSHPVGPDAANQIPNSFFRGLDAVGRVLACFSVDELDQLLLDCNADEREVMIGSLVLRLRNK